MSSSDKPALTKNQRFHDLRLPISSRAIDFGLTYHQPCFGCYVLACPGFPFSSDTDEMLSSRPQRSRHHSLQDLLIAKRASEIFARTVSHHLLQMRAPSIFGDAGVVTIIPTGPKSLVSLRKVSLMDSHSQDHWDRNTLPCPGRSELFPPVLELLHVWRAPTATLAPASEARWRIATRSAARAGDESFILSWSLTFHHSKPCNPTFLMAYTTCATSRPRLKKTRA